VAGEALIGCAFARVVVEILEKGLSGWEGIDYQCRDDLLLWALTLPLERELGFDRPHLDKVSSPWHRPRKHGGNRLRKRAIQKKRQKKPAAVACNRLTGSSGTRQKYHIKRP
jgi:hypothetical protein